MLFSLGSCPNREDIETKIVKGGGCLQSPKFADLTGHRIELLEKNDIRVISWQNCRIDVL